MQNRTGADKHPNIARGRQKSQIDVRVAIILVPGMSRKWCIRDVFLNNRSIPTVLSYVAITQQRCRYSKSRNYLIEKSGWQPFTTSFPPMEPEKKRNNSSVAGALTNSVHLLVQLCAAINLDCRPDKLNIMFASKAVHDIDISGSFTLEWRQNDLDLVTDIFLSNIYLQFDLVIENASKPLKSAICVEISMLGKALNAFHRVVHKSSMTYKFSRIFTFKAGTLQTQCKRNA